MSELQKRHCSAERQTVFSSQTKNVRRLVSAKRQVRRTINAAIRKPDEPSEEAHTLVLALLYCAWLEASFSKLVHTPYGFSLSEIEQIKREQDRAGISAAWKKAVALGTMRVDSKKSGYVPNIRQKLESLIDGYVRDPSLIRNKIAHGQWSVALNRMHTAPNPGMTRDIQDLDVVQIEKWIVVANKICSIIESLIASPTRAFHRDYWLLLTALEEDLDRTDAWNHTQKRDLLKLKPLKPPPSGHVSV